MGYRVVHVVCSAVGKGGGVFHKGCWGTVWYTWCALLWGRGEGCSIKAGGVPCRTPGV